MKNYIVFFVFLLSLSLYSQYDFKYLGKIEVLRNGKASNFSNKVYDGDTIRTSKNAFAEIKIKNKYYYLSENTSLSIKDGGEINLVNGAYYLRANQFDSINDFKNYDKDLKVYVDPYPFYAGKVSTIYITSKDDIKIKNPKLMGSARPIVKFFEVKDASDKMKVYKSVFGIYVGAQDKKYQFQSNLELKDKTIVTVALDIDLDFTPPPPKPKQIPGVTSTMKNIISNPQKSPSKIQRGKRTS